jgi:hypothetical protein
MLTASTSAFSLSYIDRFLNIAIKEKSVIDQKDILEFLTAARELVKGEKYVVLTDGRAEHIMIQAAQDALRQNESPNRLANAIVTNDRLTESRVKLFINANSTYSPTRHFKSVDTATRWLKAILNGERKDGFMPVMIFPEDLSTEHFEGPGCDVKIEVGGLSVGLKNLVLVNNDGLISHRHSIPTISSAASFRLKNLRRFWFEYAAANQDHLLQLKISD